MKEKENKDVFKIDRREFLKKMGAATLGAVIGTSFIAKKIYAKPITKEDKYPEDLAEKISQLEKELTDIDAKINANRIKIKNLYKIRRKEAVEEATGIKDEIEQDTRLKGYKKDVLIPLLVFREYVDKGKDGEIIVKEDIPAVDDTEITKAGMILEDSCKELTAKKEELERLYEKVKNGEDAWDQIEKTEEAIVAVEAKGWQVGDEYVKLRATELPRPEGRGVSEISSPAMMQSPRACSAQLSLLSFAECFA